MTFGEKLMRLSMKVAYKEDRSKETTIGYIVGVVLLWVGFASYMVERTAEICYECIK
jgi:hypothetical protein